MSDAQPGGFLDRHYFLLRRLHSLSGVVPIGAFLLPHLTTNSSIVWGRMGGSHIDPARLERAGVAAHAGVEAFQHEVNFIHSLPALLLIEIFVLWLPIAFHAGLGVYYATTGRPNSIRYSYQDNWRYTLQRLTGYVGILYILVHIGTLRWGWDLGGLISTFDPDRAASSTAAHLQDSKLGLLVPALYVVGVLALVFHFANGLWTAAITWGLTVSASGQRKWGYVCAALGVGLGVMGLAAIYGFMVLDVDQAHAIEGLMLNVAAPGGGS